jgi:regulator of sigma E protease
LDLLALLPQLSGLVYTVVSFVVALSVIVAVHEYGHYIVGRWSGIHAEVFSLGFGPVLWSRHDKRGTKWQIAALPFGGYVKFLGDADAASGKDAEVIEAAAADPVQLRRTMHGAPLWARAATVVAGPMFNFVMSIVVFSSLALYFGAVRDPLTVGSLVPVPGVENSLAMSCLKLPASLFLLSAILRPGLIFAIPCRCPPAWNIWSVVTVLNTGLWIPILPRPMCLL